MSWGSHAIEVSEAHEGCAVLLIHAPYPGKLRFDGLPSSLLSASSILVKGLAERGIPFGIMDPGSATPSFYARLAEILRSGVVRAVCIATSTAAIEETARIAQLARQLSPNALVVVGGPHEDDCGLKVAEAIEDVDVSIAGDAEYVFAALVERHLEAASRARVADALHALDDAASLQGRGVVTSRAWGLPMSRSFDFGQAALVPFHKRCMVTRPVRFEVFASKTALPVSISRGCTYGGCTFCAEGGPNRRAEVMQDFEWIDALAERFPGKPLYFQDSIFPVTRPTTEVLLPMLKCIGVEWGCQVYLPTLSKRGLMQLVDHGCTYLYTGIESGSDAVLQALGKATLTRARVIEKVGWCRSQPVRLGLSVMLGALTSAGELLETEESIADTLGLADELMSTGASVAAFYPNIQTILPGTAVDLGLRERGISLNYYRMPKTAQFAAFEDGAVGHNYLSLASAPDALTRLTDAILAAGTHLTSLTSAPH